MTVNHEMDGEHTCSVTAIDQAIDDRGITTYFLKLEIVSGPLAGGKVAKEYRLTCTAAKEHFLSDMEMLGVPVNGPADLEEALVVAYGRRVIVRAETMPQGFVACRILEVVEGEMPPDDEFDWDFDD